MPTNAPWIPGPVQHGPWGQKLDLYRGRALEMADETNRAPVVAADADMRMWWDESLTTPLGLAKQSTPVDVATLTHIALASSPYVKSVLAEPRIRQCDVVIADAEFDSTMFLENKFADTSLCPRITNAMHMTTGRFRLVLIKRSPSRISLPR